MDIIHPDLATSGGMLETNKIGDMAQEYGVPMAMHFAGSPVSCMANVHCAAATENFLVLENHSVDVPVVERHGGGRREADRQQRVHQGAGRPGPWHHP